MEYTVKMDENALKDYRNLDGSIRRVVNKKIDRLKINPFLGKKLGNIQENNLSGFFKLYVYSKTYRIIYRLITPTEIEIIEIVGIGRRDKNEIYHIVSKRLSETVKD